MGIEEDAIAFLNAPAKHNAAGPGAPTTWCIDTHHALVVYIFEGSNKASGVECILAGLTGESVDEEGAGAWFMLTSFGTLWGGSTAEQLSVMLIGGFEDASGIVGSSDPLVKRVEISGHSWQTSAVPKNGIWAALVPGMPTKLSYRGYDESNRIIAELS